MNGIEPEKLHRRLLRSGRETLLSWLQRHAEKLISHIPGDLAYANKRLGAEESSENDRTEDSLPEPWAPKSPVEELCFQLRGIHWTRSNAGTPSLPETPSQVADRLWQLLQCHSSPVSGHDLEYGLYTLLDCGPPQSQWRQEALHWLHALEASKSEVKHLSLCNLLILVRNVDVLVDASRDWLFDALARWGGQYQDLFPVGPVNTGMRKALETGKSESWLSEDWEPLCAHCEAWTKQLLRPLEGSGPGFWLTDGESTSRIQLLKMAQELRRERLSYAKERNTRVFLKLLLVDVQIARDEKPGYSTLEATSEFEPSFWNACAQDPWIGAETLTLLWLRGNSFTGSESLVQMYRKLERSFIESFPDLGARLQRTHALGPARLLYR